MKLKKSLASVLTSAALFSMCTGTMVEASKKVPQQNSSNVMGSVKEITEQEITEQEITEQEITEQEITEQEITEQEIAEQEISAMAKKVLDNLNSKGLWRKIKTIRDEIIWKKKELIEKEKKANKKELEKFKQAQEEQIKNLKLKHSEELNPIEQELKELDNQIREFWRTLHEDIAKKMELPVCVIETLDKGYEVVGVDKDIFTKTKDSLLHTFSEPILAQQNMLITKKQSIQERHARELEEFSNNQQKELEHFLANQEREYQLFLENLEPRIIEETTNYFITTFQPLVEESTISNNPSAESANLNNLGITNNNSPSTAPIGTSRNTLNNVTNTQPNRSWFGGFFSSFLPSYQNSPGTEGSPSDYYLN